MTLSHRQQWRQWDAIFQQNTVLFSLVFICKQQHTCLSKHNVSPVKYSAFFYYYVQTKWTFFFNTAGQSIAAQTSHFIQKSTPNKCRNIAQTADKHNTTAHGEDMVADSVGQELGLVDLFQEKWGISIKIQQFIGDCVLILGNLTFVYFCLAVRKCLKGSCYDW